MRPGRPLTRRELRELETEAARQAELASGALRAPAPATGADASAQAPWVQQASAQQAPVHQVPAQHVPPQPAPAPHAPAQLAAEPRPVHPSFDELFSGSKAPTPSPVAETRQTLRSTPAAPFEAEPIDHPVARRSASVMSAGAQPAEAPVAPARRSQPHAVESPAVAPHAVAPTPAASEHAGFDDLFAGLGDEGAADLADTGRRSGRADRGARDRKAEKGGRKAEKPAKAAKGRFGAKPQPEVAAAPAPGPAQITGGAATAAAAASASADFASLITAAAAGPRTEPIVVPMSRPEPLAGASETPAAPRGGVAESDDLAAMIAAAGAEAEAYAAQPASRRANIGDGPESHPAASARRAAGGSSRVTGRTAAAGARPVASASQPVRPARRRNRTRSIASVVAMGFAAMLAVATSVPSMSLLTHAEVQAMALEGATTTTIDGQRVQINDGVLAQGVESEGYKTQTIEEYAEAAGIRAEATFTNNPAGTVQWPFAVGVHIGDRYGYRDCAGCSSDHHGQDFNPGYGADIQAVADGVVVESTDAGGSLGTVIMIEHEIDGQTIASVYAHMIEGSRLFEIGETVEVGDVIGETGNTGMSTGPHLHFEIRIGGMDGEWVDPLEWLYANTN